MSSVIRYRQFHSEPTIGSVRGDDNPALSADRSYSALCKNTNSTIWSVYKDCRKNDLIGMRGNRCASVGSAFCYGSQRISRCIKNASEDRCKRCIIEVRCICNPTLGFTYGASRTTTSVNSSFQEVLRVGYQVSHPMDILLFLGPMTYVFLQYYACIVIIIGRFLQCPKREAAGANLSTGAQSQINS